MPQIGLGCANGLDEAGMLNLVSAAVDAGYRAFDTAPRYNNERGLGSAIRTLGLCRQDVFVTTKVWTSDLGREATLRSFEGSLERLGFDYVDLYLIHFPAPTLGPLYIESWLTLEELYRIGKIRAVGVANFEPHHLAAVVDAGSIVPAVNQVELHPRLQQREVRAANEALGIRTEAWSPMAMGQTLREKSIAVMAEKRSASPAQIILRWHLQQGTIVIPRTRKPSHLLENIGAVDLPPLDEEELAFFTSLDCGGRIGPHPDEWVDGPRGSVLKDLDSRYERIMQGLDGSLGTEVD
jgi:2,5-diketo-D-gluconate reductase A